jgi:hypothetical protein
METMKKPPGARRRSKQRNRYTGTKELPGE